MKKFATICFVSLFFGFITLPSLADAQTSDLQKTHQLLELGTNGSGSIVIANGERASLGLASSVGVQVGFGEKVIAVTGNLGFAVQKRLQVLGAQRKVHKDPSHRGFVLLLTGDSAFEFMKVVTHVYGQARFKSSGKGLTVLKGGAHEIISCLDHMIRGTLYLGINIANLTIDTVWCSLKTMYHFTRTVFTYSGHLVVKTAKNVVIVAKYTAKGICEIVHVMANGTIELTKAAVVGGFRLVQGTLEKIANVVEEFFGCFLRCNKIALTLKK
jgi:hypothetical protein